MSRTETADFWVGVFRDESTFYEYFGESDEYYRRLDDNPAFVAVPRKGNPRTPGTIPLSRFIGDQGQDWYDHDMAEMGFSAEATTIQELVDGYSYSDQWADELALRVTQLDIGSVNAFCFITSGTVTHAKSVKCVDFVLEYVGQITYQV